VSCEHRCPRGLSGFDLLILGFFTLMVISKLNDVIAHLDALKPKVEAAR
jgi:hypothetical protein